MKKIQEAARPAGGGNQVLAALVTLSEGGSAPWGLRTGEDSGAAALVVGRGGLALLAPAAGALLLPDALDRLPWEGSSGSALAVSEGDVSSGCATSLPAFLDFLLEDCWPAPLLVLMRRWASKPETRPFRGARIADLDGGVDRVGCVRVTGAMASESVRLLGGGGYDQR